MNKYTFWKKRIISKINELTNKYRCEIQLVPNLSANACVLKLEEKYIIFISNKLDNRLLLLSLFHEIGHIKFNTITSNPKKYNYINEMLSNIYAVLKLNFYFKLHQKFILLFFAVFSEKKLFKYFKKNNILGGDFIYEKISRDE